MRLGKYTCLAVAASLALAGAASAQIQDPDFEAPGVQQAPWVASSSAMAGGAGGTSEVEFAINSQVMGGCAGWCAARIGPVTGAGDSPNDLEYVWQKFQPNPLPGGGTVNIAFDADTSGMQAPAGALLGEIGIAVLVTPTGRYAVNVLPGLAWARYEFGETVPSGCAQTSQYTIFFAVVDLDGNGVSEDAMLVDNVYDFCDPGPPPSLGAAAHACGPGTPLGAGMDDARIQADDKDPFVCKTAGAGASAAGVPDPYDKDAGGPGRGRITFGPFPLDVAVQAQGAPVNNGFLGVEELNGRIFVSARDPALAGQHVLYEFDQNCQLVNTLPQEPIMASGAIPMNNTTGTSSSAWGFRDGDDDGTNLMFGYEGGISVIDPNTGALVTQVIAGNGPQALAANPIAGPALAQQGNYRAVAFDPSGNGGNGSIWTANFGSVMVEIDLGGAILNQFGPGNWVSYGHALDPLDPTRMYINSVPNASDIVEMDLVAQGTTGVNIKRALPGSAQGGLCAVLGGLAGGPPAVPNNVNSVVDLLGLDQAAPDTITGYRLHTQGTFLGSQEASLVTGVETCGLTGTATFDTTTKTWFGGDNIGFGYDLSKNPTGLTGQPVTLVASLGLDTRCVATTPPPSLGIGQTVTDFVLPNSLSAPPAALGAFVLSDGIGIGPIVNPNPLFNIPIGPPTLTDVTTTSIIVPGVALPAGSRIQLQALYLDTGAPLSLRGTNRAEFISGGLTPPSTFCVEVSATGANSFNGDTTEGFWKVRHTGTCAAIQDVTFDLTPLTGMVFDTDQTGMADAFWGGNSTLVGTCSGTYRNGSDVATGLIYDCMNTYVDVAACAGGTAVGCDPVANCGFIGTNPGVANSFSTVQFRFNCSDFFCKTFEFDSDTDGGPGITGAAMAGAMVTVTLCDSTVFMGALAVDPSTPNRSFVQF